MKSSRILKFITILFLLGSSIFIWSYLKGKKSEEKFRSVPVEKGDIRISIQATGTAQPQNRLEVKPPIPGRIESIRVREGERVQRGDVLAWLSSTERAALLDAARAKGEKEVSYWEEVYKTTPLVAPMDGVVIVRNMEPGQTVAVQDVPFVLSDRLIIRAQVDETDIGKIKKGQESEIVLDAYPQFTIPGKVDHIAYESKTINNVTIYEVEVLPSRVPAFMRAGMTSNLSFIVEEKKNVLLLPEEAIQYRNGETKVLVPGDEEPSKKRVYKEIKTGLSDGKKTEIREGLNLGETVLVREIKVWKSNGKEAGRNPFMPFGGRRR